VHPDSKVKRNQRLWQGRDFSREERDLLTEIGADWLWETDTAHRFTWISPSFQTMTGLDPSRFIGSQLNFAGHAADEVHGLAAHLEQIEKRAPFRDLVFELKGAVAASRWVSANGHPRFDAEGRFCGYRGSGRNITPLLRFAERANREVTCEEALLDAKEQAEDGLSDLRLTIDAMQMAIVVVNGDLKAEIINKAFYRLWKIAPADAPVGSTFRHLIDINRHNAIYDVKDGDWDSYVTGRLAEIEAGSVEPREFQRADGCTVIYSVTPLSGNRRLVTYYDVSEMKAHEAELAEALEKARLSEAVIDSVSNPIFVKNRDLEYVFVNKIFAARSGTTPAEMIGRKVGDFVPAEEAAIIEAKERAILDTGESVDSEEDFELNGLVESLIVRTHRVEPAAGRQYLAGMIFDVTEIKRRQREADEARRRLADVLEALPAGVIIYDHEDRFVYGNRKIHDTLPAMKPAMQPGRPLREAIERAHAAGYFRQTDEPELDAIYDTDREAWIERYLARYQRKLHIFERRNSDGRWYKAFDTRTEDGTFIGVRVDITELKEREEDLRRSMGENELFRNLIDNVPVSIYAKHPDLRLMYVNKGWCDLTGLGSEAAIGRTDREIFGLDGSAFMESDREVLRTHRTLEIEETATAPDGKTRYQIARKGAMTTSDGSLYLIGSTTDVTELRRREEELRDAQEKAVLADRAKSEFLANMSHEIRTPMNGVLGMAELLAKSELSPKQKTFTDIIVKSGNALMTIINDILDFSKIDAGQLVLDPAPFHLAEAIEDVATLVSTRAKEKDLELIVRIDPSLAEIFVGDVGRIRQIVTNLLGNAVKFTEKGHVLVEVSGEPAEEKATRLTFRVSDTGIGIPRDKLALIFDKFSQVDSSSTRRHEGTGLGLAITSRLLDLMGGEIGVESEEGRGSTFTCSLTLPNGSRTGRSQTAPVDVSGARILIVDDNGVNRSILSEQFNGWGFDSCAAESGPEGLQVLKIAAARDLSVDCIVLDYQMPKMTGLDMARIVRDTAHSADIPIIMLTSVDQSLSPSICRELNLEAQLIKPARSSVLLETVVGTIQKARGARDGGEGQASGEAQQAAASAPQTRPQSEPQRRRRQSGEGGAIDILVAEDNEVNQLVFSQILAETGFRFHIAENGKRAVETYRASPPRLILMDVSMPEMNGLEATAAIREMEEASGVHVPIVGVTAHALKGDRERCIEAGMDDYLSKPISPKALTEKLQRWLGDGQGNAATA
jgi:PAS domain S-box-containing protein